MEVLKFTAPVGASGPKFSAVAAFDNYFSFSGRKYRVVEPCTVNGKQGYRVEKHEVKQNLLLNILKVISFMTFIIPLIMGIGKLIARSKYGFFVEKTSELKVLPPKEQDLQETAREIQKFKNKALEVFHQSKSEQCLPLESTLTPEQEIHLRNAIRNHTTTKPVVGVKVVHGGGHSVYFLDQIPGFVFKPMIEKKDAEKYVAVAEKARQIVIEDKLYLLHVPQAKVLHLDDQYYVMQERANIVSGSYKAQKGIYLTYWADKEMRNYMKEVFSQLITFISKMGFSDVKYDNIPFTSDGKIALIDLETDEGSRLTGLIFGGAGKNDGLFNYIPFEYLDDFLAIAKEQLEEKIYQQLVQKFESIKTRAAKKANKDQDYAKFAEKNLISSPTQNLNPDLPKIFDDKKKQKFARSIIESINKELSDSKNFSLRCGRTTRFDINNGDPLTKKAQGIWGNRQYYISLVRSIFPEVLEGLKGAGYIHQYKIVLDNHYMKVVC